ncbi:MAG: CU044_2847 family protein [Acidimicrobiales bacterium]
MGSLVGTTVDGVELMVEVSGSSGPANVSLDQSLPFTNVGAAIRAIGGEVMGAVRAAGPDSATVEFSLGVKVKEGRLTGILVSGGADASIKVTMTWDGESSGRRPGGDASS